MGRQKKQYSRHPAGFGRAEEVRDPQPLILIVCEGACTEPYYFDGLRRDLRLSNVQVAGKECGSDPASVVQYALDRHSTDKFEHIFCVVDRDEHQSFDQAVNLVRTSADSGIPIQIIPSYPSFEFWYILHLQFTRAPIVRTGKTSSGANAVRILKKHMKPKGGYEKSAINMWSQLKSDLPKAIRNSLHARKEASQDGEPNPSTDVDKLVSFLFGCSEKQEPN
jgi:hypothetical protein